MAKKLDKTNILLKHIINVIQDAKGKEIISLDLRKIESAICKYFIICTGTSNTHVKAIQENVKRKVQKSIKQKPWHVEEDDAANWILMDYSGIILHIFQEETRIFYSLEELWGDAKMISYK